MNRPAVWPAVRPTIRASDVALALARARVPADVVRTDIDPDGAVFDTTWTWRRSGVTVTHVDGRAWAVAPAKVDGLPPQSVGRVARTPAQLQALAAKVARALGGGR